MVPNILIAPLSDKVKGAALYHKPTARIESYRHFQLGGGQWKTPGAHHHPPLPRPLGSRKLAPSMYQVGKKQGRKWRDL